MAKHQTRQQMSDRIAMYQIMMAKHQQDDKTSTNDDKTSINMAKHRMVSQSIK